MLGYGLAYVPKARVAETPFGGHGLDGPLCLERRLHDGSVDAISRADFIDQRLGACFRSRNVDQTWQDREPDQMCPVGLCQLHRIDR